MASDSKIVIPHENELHRKKNIALFGLSANPPTGQCGHAGIVKYLTELGRFDEIWVLPVYDHIYDSKRDLAPYEDRIAMCTMCFERESTDSCKVRVLRFEEAAFIKNGRKRAGTIDVIRLINSIYKGLRLTLVLGSDTFSDLLSGKWKESDRVLEQAQIAVLKRGDSVPNIPIQYHTWSINNVSIHDVPSLGDVSSTAVRDLLRDRVTNEAALKKLLHPAVLSYIVEHNLYSPPPLTPKFDQRNKGFFIITACVGLILSVCLSYIFFGKE